MALLIQRYASELRPNTADYSAWPATSFKPDDWIFDRVYGNDANSVTAPDGTRYRNYTGYVTVAQDGNVRLECAEVFYTSELTQIANVDHVKITGTVNWNGDGAGTPPSGALVFLEHYFIA